MRKKAVTLDTSNPIGGYYDEQLTTLHSRLIRQEPSFEDLLNPPAPPASIGNVPAPLLELGLDPEELQLLAAETPPEGLEFIAWAANHQ